MTHEEMVDKLVNYNKYELLVMLIGAIGAFVPDDKHEDLFKTMEKTIGDITGVEKMKYRKKPVVVDAIQFNGNNAFKIYEFIGKPITLNNREDHEQWGNFEQYLKENGFKINTLEGMMTANVGDYIIKGVKGEFYPCREDIFEATYEKVEKWII